MVYTPAIAAGIPTLLFAGLATLAASESTASSVKQSIAADRRQEAAVAQAEAAREQIRPTEFQYNEQQRQAAVQRNIDGIELWRSLRLWVPLVILIYRHEAKRVEETGI